MIGTIGADSSSPDLADGVQPAQKDPGGLQGVSSPLAQTPAAS